MFHNISAKILKLSHVIIEIMALQFNVLIFLEAWSLNVSITIFKNIMLSKKKNSLKYFLKYYLILLWWFDPIYISLIWSLVSLYDISLLLYFFANHKIILSFPGYWFS